MARILITFSTTDGHTLKICQRLRQIVETHGHEVTLTAIGEADADDLAQFDRLVIGARIRYGRHSPLVYEFIRRNRALLDSRPNAFFSVSVVARKPGKDSPETNPYMRKFLRKSGWRPKRLAVFAGKIDYSRYRFLDRMVIRFIMWMTRGPTQADAVVEFTDWNKVEEFGHLIAGPE